MNDFYYGESHQTWFARVAPVPTRILRLDRYSQYRAVCTAADASEQEDNSHQEAIAHDRNPALAMARVLLRCGISSGPSCGRLLSESSWNSIDFYLRRPQQAVFCRDPSHGSFAPFRWARRSPCVSSCVWTSRQLYPRAEQVRSFALVPSVAIVGCAAWGIAALLVFRINGRR